MTTEDEWKLAFDDILRKSLPKDSDWTLPQPKPIISAAIESFDWGNLLENAFTGTKSAKKTVDTQSSDLDWDIPKVDPAVEARYKQYTDVLEEYIFHGSPEKSQFFNDDPNCGYKVHLNVLPANVIAVSNFLKNHEFHHKYLHGGEIEDGKIFTVYLGSKAATERYVREIYEGVGDLLEHSKAYGEVEYAPRIVGRFVGGKKYFRQYGREGISLLYDLPSEHPLNTPERAREKALEEYGEYFGGGITPYSPFASIQQDDYNAASGNASA